MRKTLSIIVMLLMLAGCTVSNLSAEEVLKKMETAESYSAEAKMAVKNNKSVFYYNLKQFYKQQDKFRVEFYDDYGNLKQTMIYNDGQCAIYHSKIDKPFKTQNFLDAKEHNSFITTFIGYYKEDPEANWSRGKINDDDYYVFRCNMKSNNSFFSSAELYVNSKNAVPKMLCIYGEDGGKTMEVEYKSFKYNVSIDDSMFFIE